MSDALQNLDTPPRTLTPGTQITPADLLDVINDGAMAYKDALPGDLYSEPYMTQARLLADMADGVAFTGLHSDGVLVAVIGVQPRDGATLIRHLYVRRAWQSQGLGGWLLQQALAKIEGPVLIGCLTAMHWAIAFYQKHGFRILPPETILPVRKRFWRLPENHLRQSVALGNAAWHAGATLPPPASAAAAEATLTARERCELGLNLLQILYGQITDHKTVRDRWFQYYLTIIGLPLGVLAALSQSKLFADAHALSAIHLVGALSSAVFLILGVLFFLLFIGQRVNYLAVYQRVLKLEADVVSPALHAAAPDTRVRAVGQFRADSYAIGVHIMLNSCWAALMGYCGAVQFIGHDSGWRWGLAAILFPIAAISQILVRRTLLERAESSMKGELVRAIPPAGVVKR